MGSVVRKCCTYRTLKKRLPILVWLPQYSVQWLRMDLLAGMTVGLTVVPQGLAYAEIAGLPMLPDLLSFSSNFCSDLEMQDGFNVRSMKYYPLRVRKYGLYSSFMGCFVYCLLGTSKDITLGPTAIMSLLVASYANHDPVYAVLLAFLCGCFQLAMGILQLGFLVDFISYPVIKGFTSSAAVTIGFGQVK
eukprot:g41162.t1